MRTLITLASLVLLALASLAAPSTTAQVTPTPTTSPTPIPLPQLDLAWEPGGLRVRWSTWRPGCLALVGGLPDQRLADIPCATSGDVVLPIGGVDQAYTPLRRTHVEVRAADDLRYVMAGQAIPPRYQRALPAVVQPIE